MANPIRINAASLNRPGVFVTQSSSGSLPEPVATHAVGYIFGTTPTEDYYGKDAINTYSAIEPYIPTQIGSVQDYLEKVGGEIPVGNKGALASYDAVSGFFENVGVNGILYFTRVTPTPETVIDLGASDAGVGYNAFAIKVNGRYFGTPTGLPDNDGDEIKVIVTTGLDKQDNARDLFEFLSNEGEFSDFYRIEQTPQEALNAKFRFFSKDSRSLPKVDAFSAYQFNNSTYASREELNLPTIVKLYTSVKELNFRCVSRDVATKEPILFRSGSAISAFLDASTEGWDVETDQSDILKAFLTSGVSGNPYTSTSAIPDGKIIAISKDLTSGNPVETKWADEDATYWVYDSTGSGTFTKFEGGTKVPTGDAETRLGYLPDTVQVFYVNVAGEDRAIIVNGATPKELADGLASEIRKIFVEKELNNYYVVEAIDYDPIEENVYAPNNGHSYSDLVADAGSPYLRPELEDVSLSGTISVSDGVVTGVGTNFTTELALGDIFVARGTRFTVIDIEDDGEMTVSPSNVDVEAGSTFSLDKSIPNGFYSFDYVLKIKITSKNGVSSPVNQGSNRFGELDPNVSKLISTDQNAGYEGYKLTQTAKANDFVYAIEQGMDSRNLPPGFLFAPEAYTVLTYDADGGPTNDIASKSEARQERLKITQALNRAASGALGKVEGISGTQHIALIDPGDDELSLNDVRDEMDRIKKTVGVPFGHSAFYAPYVKNLSDRFVAPSSYVAGIACSRYINEGFQQPPAGARYPLRGVTGIRFDISAQQQEVTYALGLNPIRSLPNRGIVTWGARTLSSNPLFKFANTRAILNVLIDVLGRSFDDILFEQIDSAGTVYARVKSIASQVCGQFFRQGALFGSRPEQAYLVVCSTANNSNLDLENGTVRLDVYVATSPTFERLLVSIFRTPAGQVVQLSDSFSRNEDRFSTLLTNTNVFR